MRREVKPAIVTPAGSALAARPSVQSLGTANEDARGAFPGLPPIPVMSGGGAATLRLIHKINFGGLIML